MYSIHTRNPRTTLSVLASAVVSFAVVAGCGGSSDADDAAAAEQGVADTLASTRTEPGDRPAPDTSAGSSATDPTSSGTDDNSPLALADALVVGTLELPRGDLGFLVSDGESLWATGNDGAVVRIDPDSGGVEELTVGDGLIRGQLLPAVTDDGIWLSAIQGSHLVRLDPATRSAGRPIEVPGVLGLVHVGLDGQMWMESTGPPAGLVPFDPESGTIGDVMPIDTDGEVIGGAVAFDSLWLPLYDDRTVLRLDERGEVTDRVPSGVGPAYVRAAHGMLWHPNWIDGTVSRIDPGGLDVTTIDLNGAGDTIEAPSGITATADAIWLRAGRLDDRAAIIFRIDPDAAEIVGRRTLPGGRRIDQIGGMAAHGDRLFVLDRPGRVLLELDVEQFLEHDSTESTDSDETTSPDELAIREAVRTLLATATTPADMQSGIVDGERLTDQVAAFKQFFVDNLPGEDYEGGVLSVRLDGDRADLEFVVTVAGEPIVETIQGSMVLEEGRWLLTTDLFCRLAATGGIDCPPDLDTN